MKNWRNALLGLLVMTAALAARADAQLVTYQFTGTYASGTAGIGSSIAGTLTLDVGVAPSSTQYDNDGCGELGYWKGGGFALDAATNTGFVAGTLQGGHTDFWNYDLPCYSWQHTGIQSRESNGSTERVVFVYTDSYVPGDGIATVPNPWNALAEDFQHIYVHEYDPNTGVYEWGQFSLDTFTLVPATIIIDGCDTGIDDFEYQGKWVSEHLADCAAAALNHGDYNSRVALLTNDLQKAGLLTSEQKSVIMECAAESSIGK